MQLFLSYILSAPAVQRLFRGFARVAAARNGRSCDRMPGRKAAAFYSAAIALALLTASLTPSPVRGALIVNSARFTSNGAIVANASVNVTLRTPSRIEFLKYTPGATSVNVARSAYRTGNSATSTFTDMAPPVLAGSTTAIDLTQPVPLAGSAFFHQGEPIFIRVTDLDQNLDRTRAETVIVTITDDVTLDEEVVRLTETGPDTGVFTGYIQSTGDSASRCITGSFP